MIDDRRLRSDPIQALGAIGPDAEAAIPRLLQELKSNETSNRRFAAIALGRIDRQGQTVPALIEQLDKDWLTVAGAVRGLRMMGPQARSAVPALIASLEHTHAYVRFHTAETLGNIGPDARAAIPALKRVLHASDQRTAKRTGSYWENVPRAAAEAIRKIGG